MLHFSLWGKVAQNLAQLLRLFTTILVRYKFLELNVPGKKIIL